jgi:hypothetical protein
MKSKQDKMDLIFHAYSKNWLRKLKHSSVSSSLGFFITGMFILLWSSELTHFFGYRATNRVGSLIFAALVMFIALLIITINTLLTRAGIDKPHRSGILLASIVGPFVGLSLQARWQTLALSHVVSFFSAITAYWLSFSLDRLLEHNHPSDRVESHDVQSQP